MQHKTFSGQVKQFDDEKLIIENFISTERKDRGGDIMRVSGMVMNGKVVVLMEHGQGNLGREPIAKPLSIVPSSFNGIPGLLAKTQFYDGSHLNPPDNTGRRLYEKAKGGYLSNWSIGYTVIDAIPLADGGRDVQRWELLEYSAVGVPMQSDAQTLMKDGTSALQFKVQHYTIGSDPMGSEDYVNVRGFTNTNRLFEHILCRVMRLRDEAFQRGLRKMLGRVD